MYALIVMQVVAEQPALHQRTEAARTAARQGAGLQAAQLWQRLLLGRGVHPIWGLIDNTNGCYKHPVTSKSAEQSLR